jgi:hypothetical protein
MSGRNELGIDLQGDRRSYAPGQALRGVVRWAFDRPPRSAEVQLVWRTEGKGNTDARAAVRQPLSGARYDAQHRFEITIPPGPMTYHGTILSILWTVEAVTDNPDASAKVDIVVSPHDQPVRMRSTGDQA